MQEHYRDLGIFSDWVGAAHQQQTLRPFAEPGPQTQYSVRDLLGFTDESELPADVRTERAWTRDGLSGEEVTWSVGYGPRTHAWVLRPADARDPLPGVLALHGHDGFKYFGKEKIADGPGEPPASVTNLRTELYQGRAFANVLAARGFVVLVHDVFLWGSRGFPLDTILEATQPRPHNAAPAEMLSNVERYNAAAGEHEHLVAKYCSMLGTSLAGVVSHEDRAAVSYLCSRPDVDTDRVGCAGLSGGGCRAALLQATCDHVNAAVIVGMMSIHEQLIDHHVGHHTWMFFPPGLATQADWPDLAACRAPSPLLVQYNRGDHLFTTNGMRAAHDRITAHYHAAGNTGAYRGEFYDGPHKFDQAMQDSAFCWVAAQLASSKA